MLKEIHFTDSDLDGVGCKLVFKLAHIHEAEGIDFEVVPGITSAIGGLCYAGIPITHRDHASSFHVVTGHLRADDKENPEINSAILEVAKYDENIDLKAVALGAFLSYRLVELAADAEGISIVEE